MSNKLFLTAFFLIAAVFAVLLVPPAYACGCGIYIPSDGDAHVTQERSLVTWDGQREAIVMSLGVLGGSKQAAIILPVPAQADVKLADAKLFDELDDMTKPLVKEETQWVFGMGLGAGAPEAMAGASAPVTVLSRQNLGPFDVANLSATNATALKAWLDGNGFALDPRITEVVKPYVDNGWTFVAIRLQPEQASAQLGGALSPLQISFASKDLVYPMRSSALASSAEALNLYVLANHRVDKDMAFGNSRVTYADWVDPAALESGSPLAPYVSNKLFLTKFEDTVLPQKVHDDFKFTFAPTDDTYRDVQTVTVERDATGFVLLGCLGVALIVGVLVLIGIILYIRRRSSHKPQPSAA